MHRVNSNLDYIGHLAWDSARFADVLREVPPDARVPCCPDWNADDLLWHLGEVQWFWGTIVHENATRQQAEDLKPERPADRAGLRAGDIIRKLGPAPTPDSGTLLQELAAAHPGQYRGASRRCRSASMGNQPRPASPPAVTPLPGGAPERAAVTRPRISGFRAP